MVILKIKIPEHLKSKTKASPAPLSLPNAKATTDKSSPVKKTRDEGSAHPKIGKRIRRKNPRPPRSGSRDQQGYADQCNGCAVSALTHFNKVAAYKMGVTYELVNAGESIALMHRKEGFVFHCNFMAKPTNCADDSETMLFFGELWKVYPEEPRVTNCCILGPVDSVCLGNNGCECDPVLHHPAEGFYIGERDPLIVQSTQFIRGCGLDGLGDLQLICGTGGVRGGTLKSNTLHPDCYG